MWWKKYWICNLRYSAQKCFIAYSTHIFITPYCCALIVSISFQLSTYKHSQRWGSQFGGYLRQFSLHHWPIPVSFLWAATGTHTWLRTTKGDLPLFFVTSGKYIALVIGILGRTTFGGRPTLLIIFMSAQFLKVSWSPQPMAPVPFPQSPQVLPY